MKLVRYGPLKKEKPGLLDADGVLRDLSDVISDLAENALTNESLAKLAALDPDSLPKVSGSPRLGAPVGRVGKLICVGLNYADHAAESGMEPPKQPVLFMKSTTSIVGPYDEVKIPRGSAKTDWEVELGVVIGDLARDVSKADAMHHVAGYLVINDVSEREFQLEHGGGQWLKGKGCDTFAPLGPWLVTRDQVSDPQDLSMWLKVNDTTYQNGSTHTMIFDVATLVSHISRYMTLEPGDVISTGTPPGVGMGQKPPLYLKAGDRIELGIAGLGKQRQNVIAA